jgi:adenylate kinase
MRGVFIGPPGSGKGTQASLLRERLQLVTIGTGDILRDAVHHGTAVGLKAKPFMENGQLVPDVIVNELVAERLRQPGAPRDFILDGYPRNVAQARALDSLLSELGLPLQAVVVFKIDDALVIRRLLARQRTDDQEETVRKRLAAYHETTEELVAYYRTRNLVHWIDAAAPIEHVYVRVASLLLPKDV